MSFNKLLFHSTLVIASLWSSACGGSPEALGGRLQVVATTTLVGDVVAQIGAEHIDLAVLVPTGVDPHSFEPSPKDAVAISEADVVFISGLGLEEFMQALLDNAGGAAELVEVSSRVATIEFADGQEQEADDEHLNTDPHVWMDPNNVVVWTDNITAALSTLDPENAASYQANAEAYRAELLALDEWIRTQVAQLDASQRILVTDHDSFGYLAAAYGFEIVGAIIPGFSTQASPSAGELADLEGRVVERNVPAIFVGSTVNPQLADQLAEDLGVSVVQLYTGSLSDVGGPASSYLEFMRYNVEAIVTALSQAR